MTIKIIHVVEAVEGGIARHVRDIVRHVEAEHLVVLPAERVGGLTDTSAVADMAEAGAQLHTIPMSRSVTDFRNLRAVARVRCLIRRMRPDVVHGHSSIGGVVARIAGTQSGAIRVYTPNGLLPSRCAMTFERMLGRFTDGFVAVSESEAALARRLRLVKPSRIAVIPNGIELDLPGPSSIDVRSEFGVGKDTSVIATVGRLARQKAPEVFIRACARIAAARPDVRFVLIADGPLRGAVAHEVSVAGIEDRLLHLPGLLGAAALMPQFDVFTLPSRYEGGPYSPLEAMRAGTPVVLTDVIGNRDIVENGKSGLLVPADDPSALATAVLQVLADSDLRGRLAEAGRARVAACFEVRKMAEDLRRLYEKAKKGESA